MKFAYVDESGDEGQSDVFVMVGCVVDAYSLRRITADFDAMLKDLRERHPSQPSDLKTKAFINGDGGWRVVPPAERKALLRSICQLASHDSKLFASALSFERFRNADRNHPAGRTYWHAASVFVTSLIQKKMQKVSNNKGLTVLVMDDNKAGMPALSDAIYAADPWFDGLYQIRGRRRGVGAWVPRTAHDRFNQIINTAFAIKSDHSSLVQVADALAYVYRRHLELRSIAEAYAGERALYDELAGIVEASREKLGRCPDCEAVAFYRAIAPEGWTI
jgi:Protein of unknown function (DUF3800)